MKGDWMCEWIEGEEKNLRRRGVNGEVKEAVKEGRVWGGMEGENGSVNGSKARRRSCGAV